MSRLWSIESDSYMGDIFPAADRMVADKHEQTLRAGDLFLGKTEAADRA